MFSKKKRAFITLAMLAMIALVSIMRDPQFKQVKAQEEEYESAIWLKVSCTIPGEWYMRPFAPGWLALCDGPGCLFNDPLAIRLMNGTYVPRLATSWEYDPETGNFTVHLRQGVIWHDGETEFQSEDVLNFFTASAMYYYVPPEQQTPPTIDEVYTPDNYTVVYHVVKPTPLVFRDILTAWTGFGPGAYWMRNGPLQRFCNETVRRWIKENNTEELTKLKNEYLELKFRDPSLCLGTGPFKFTKITDDVIIVEKWDKYYLADNVKFKGVIFYVTKSRDVKDMMFLAGDVYYSTGLFGEILNTIKARPQELTLKTGVLEAIDGMLMGMKKYPLSVKEFRQALAYANNATAVCIYTGYGDVPCQQIALYPAQINYWLTPDFISRLRNYTYDIDRANKLLDDLGWFDTDGDGIRETDNGTKLEFRMATPAEWMITSGDWYATEWLKLGVKVEVVPVPVNQYFVELSKWDFDMFAYYGVWAREQPADLALMYTVTSWSPEPYFKVFYTQMVDVPEWVDPTAGTVNITQLAMDAAKAVDLEEQKRITRILVWYTNEYVPQIFWGLYGRIYGFNIQKLAGLEDVSYLDPRLFASGCDSDVLSVLITTGVLKPILNLNIPAVGGGTTNPSSGVYGYTTNDTVTVTALAASGFKFDHWELDGEIVSTEETYTVTMDDEHVLTPIFATQVVTPPPYELYAAIGVLAVLMVAGWALAVMWRRRVPPRA